MRMPAPSPTFGSAFVAPRWSIYFRVADTYAAAAKAVDLGATVVQPAMDTPYGRIAALTDPTAAAFKLLG